MRLKQAWQLVKETFTGWSEDKVPRLSAALAYFTIFSIAPIIVIAVAVAGMAFGKEAAQGQIHQQIQGLVGEAGARTIQDMVAHSQSRSSGMIASIVGLGALIFGATGAFAELKSSLNTIWGVEQKPGSGMWQTIRERFLSFTMVLGVGFLLLVSLVISAGLSAFAQTLSGLFPGMNAVMVLVDLLVSLGIVTLLFAMIYKILPDVEIAWRDVWVGSASTAVLFVIGKFLIGFYLGRFAVGSTYGAAGALIVVLLWVYYSAQILFLGAEFTQVYSRYLGSRIVPSEDAVPLTQEARLKQGKAERRHAEARPEEVGWNRRERPATIGSLGSLIVGIVLGLFYRRKGRV